ncbi:hypothetical protein EHS13_22185 [Paenibacillus psychroresistens]|uniref:Uncharacterized protein n=1 Tax=Paenibacillus psychroresistens TaxID=1778678 RepID=A0A6B8RMY3_9BACL|nr:hypothetical protein [Paenibacillus psychroresistens]QGQ97399.1 hypothetical protein EHS13_22185 [Paenibacillus psychroresistens]
MPIPRLPQNDREITYQVGWKKGTIHKKVDIETPAAIVVEPKGLISYIWHKAPSLPASMDLYVLCALPLISVLAIAALIYFLTQS